jgi:alpha-beta hydrolase superfamily lysophospholipase
MSKNTTLQMPTQTITSAQAGRVVSKDGTVIAFETAGQGPSVILIDGALCYREMGPSRELAKQLAKQFTVLTYDRRGRGKSGDTAPYDVLREVEDIAALVKLVAWLLSGGFLPAQHSRSRRRLASTASGS